MIEPILVIMVIGFIILTLNNLPGAFGLIGDSHFQSTAKDIASQEIEDARSSGYTNLANGINSVSDPRMSSLSSGNATLTVADCPSNICQSGEKIKEVTAAVSWTENGAAKSYQITTLIASGGLK